MNTFSSALFFSKSRYSLRKAKKVFFEQLKLYKRKKNRLSASSSSEMKKSLERAQEALLTRDLDVIRQKIAELESFSKIHMQKDFLDKLRDFFGAIFFALAIAVIVRQMWFEFYEIPTGSMRPTLKEKDGLVVSKNQFGINIPLMAKHFQFNPEGVKRGGIIVFSGQDMDIHDVNTMYFYLFPGKKQLIKRMIGKPGDTLYFYGGHIYGIDKNGNDISSEIQRENLDKIVHIPYIHFEGKAISSKTPTNGIYNQVVVYQMNEPVAKLQMNANRQIQAEMLPLAKETSPKIQNYEDLWGFKNYAMARILDRKQYLAFNGSNLENIEPCDYYLELTHTPSLKNASLARDYYGRVRPSLGLSKSYLPLKETHLKRLFDNLYTARFLVDKKGFVTRYDYKKSAQSDACSPKLENVPAGTYEFYHGIAYEVGFQGVTKKLPASHPLYKYSAEKALMLFNLGIEMDTRFNPQSPAQALLPSRYAFFRDESLYVMDAPIYLANEKELDEFVKNEHLRSSNPSKNYLPFIDHKKPYNKEGKIDTAFIKQYGITVPDKQYLVLGDNYAMSADSRDFGFVPEQNLKGVPEFLFWPPGSRFGLPNQPFYTVATASRLIVWLLGLSAIIFSVYLHRRNTKLPQKLD